MEKLIKVVDEKRGIVQVTTVTERWYARSVEDPVTRLPEWTYFPSVTWICSYFPRGTAFWKWLAEKGWDESLAIRDAAGARGSKVHAAVASLLLGIPVAMEDFFENPKTGQPEALTLEEYEAILSFKGWWDEFKPTVIAQDVVIWNEAQQFAGTLDLVCEIGGKVWIVDFKTSAYLWPSHEIQVSAYKHADHKWKDANLAILQLGYGRNKKGFKWTEIEDQFDLFMAVRQIWAKETAGEKPKQKDYPVSIQLQETPKPEAAQEAHAGATD